MISTRAVKLALPPINVQSVMDESGAVASKYRAADSDAWLLSKLDPRRIIEASESAIMPPPL